MKLQNHICKQQKKMLKPLAGAPTELFNARKNGSKNSRGTLPLSKYYNIVIINPLLPPIRVGDPVRSRLYWLDPENFSLDPDLDLILATYVKMYKQIQN